MLTGSGPGGARICLCESQSPQLAGTRGTDHGFLDHTARDLWLPRVLSVLSEGSEDSREVLRPQDGGMSHPPGFKHILGLPEAGQTQPCPPSTAAGADITACLQGCQTRAWGAAWSCKVLRAHSHSHSVTGRLRLLPGFHGRLRVMTEALWPIKTEIFTIWPFMEKLVSSWRELGFYSVTANFPEMRTHVEISKEQFHFLFPLLAGGGRETRRVIQTLFSLHSGRATDRPSLAG